MAVRTKTDNEAAGGDLDHAETEHEHMHSHGAGCGHDHPEAAHSAHTHTHDPQEIRKIVNRLSRCAGHLEAVKHMVERGEDCSDVLIQMAAVRSELTNAGKALLKEHLEHCIVEAAEQGDQASIERMNEAIDRFIKY